MGVGGSGGFCESLPPFLSREHTVPSTTKYLYDKLYDFTRLPAHWLCRTNTLRSETNSDPLTIKNAQAASRPSNFVRVQKGQGISFSPYARITYSHSYTPYDHLVTIAGRVHVRKLVTITPMRRTKTDCVVWFVTTRNSEDMAGNGVICALVQRCFHFWRDMYYNHYEMHIAVSAAPYRPSPAALSRRYLTFSPGGGGVDPFAITGTGGLPEELEEWDSTSAYPDIAFPFFTRSFLHVEPTEHDVFDFKVTDDGHTVTFQLSRYTASGNSEHSLKLSTPFQGVPCGNQGGWCPKLHLGMGAGDALYDQLVVSDLLVSAEPSQKPYILSSPFSGFSPSEYRSVLLASRHPSLGRHSSLRHLTMDLFARILLYLELVVELIDCQGKMVDTDSGDDGRGQPTSNNSTTSISPATDSTATAASVPPPTELHTNLSPTQVSRSVSSTSERFVFPSIWMRPKLAKSSPPLLKTVSDVTLEPGTALLISLRYVHTEVRKKLAVISRTSWALDKKKQFVHVGIRFSIAGGNTFTENVTQHDPREVYQMVVSVENRIIASQYFGTVRLGDTFEYIIYDDGLDFGFQVLHYPTGVLENTGQDPLHPTAPSTPRPVSDDSPRPVDEPAPTLPHPSSNDCMEIPPANIDVENDKAETRSLASSLGEERLTPLSECHCYVLRGRFEWAAGRFPILLTLPEPEGKGLAPDALAYEKFSVHKLACSGPNGCPF